MILTPMKDLGEAVSELFFRANGKKMEEIGLHFFTDDMAIDVEVLGVFMEALVMGNMARGFVVAVHYNSMSRLNLKIMEEIAQPLDFTGCGC